MSDALSILCFSSTDWDGVWGSRQQVMLRLAARGHRILLVEQPAGLEHLWRYSELRRRRARRRREGCREIADNLWIYSPPPLLPGRYYSHLINRVNQSITAAGVKRALARLEMQPDVLWVYQPEMAPLLGRFKERASVYHCIDEHTATATGRKRRVITAMEERLLREVDIVFANSRAIYDRKRPFNLRTYRVPSGADVDHFATAMDPELEIAPSVSRLVPPRIGYVGNINERLDYDVLDYLALAHPEWMIVLVGDTYPWTMASPRLRSLNRLANVRFLGKQAFADVPCFVKGMSVCILPYVRDERASFRSPLKLYEYLAAGKPVVATQHPEVAPIEDAVYVAATPEAFAKCVAHALEHDTPGRQQMRLGLARPHSWDKRVDNMEKRLSEFLGER